MKAPGSSVSAVRSLKASTISRPSKQADSIYGNAAAKAISSAAPALTISKPRMVNRMRSEAAKGSTHAATTKP